jgi:hypothetical protein
MNRRHAESHSQRSLQGAAARVAEASQAQATSNNTDPGSGA